MPTRRPRPPASLHPQLEALQREIVDVTVRARRLVDRLDDATFERRPAEGSWSAAECLVHLNLTTQAFLPLIDDALSDAQRGAVDAGTRYRKDVVGWLLRWVVEPPARMKVKTTPPFVPKAWSTPGDLLREFESLQADLARRIADANGCDIGRVKVRSPFSSRMRYNLLATFAVIAAHERRHLWQAERAAPGGSPVP
jgi:hypothetical protein